MKEHAKSEHDTGQGQRGAGLVHAHVGERNHTADLPTHY